MSVEIDKICRTCLGLTGPLLSIYDGDVNSCVAEMLSNFTKLKPTPTDNMPAKVCLTCISEINRCFSFKMKCENSNRTLRQLIPDAVPEEQIIKQSKPVELISTASQTISTTPMKKEQKSVEIQTIVLETTNEQLQDLIGERNKEIDKVTEELKNSNEVSSSAFHYEESSDAESVVNQPNEISLPPEENLKDVENDFNNYEIEYVEEGNDEYVVEVKKVVDIKDNMPVESDEDILMTPLKTSAAQNEEETIYEITQPNNRNKQTVEENESASLEKAKVTDMKVLDIFYDAKRKRNEFICLECTQTFISLNVLRRHLAKFHNIQVSEENVDKIDQRKVAKSPTNLQEFLDLPKLKYTCNKCKAPFTTKRALQIHKKKNVCSTECQKCEICERVFETVEQLETHKTNDHEAKFIGCMDCDQMFANQEALSKHQVEQHKRNLQYQCNICKKVFTMMSTLKDHLRIHTGEKPFQCSICSMAFSQKSNMKQHMQRHEKAKTFKCPQCDDSFVTRSELFSHQRKHTGAQPYKCDFCTAAFSTNSSLNKHRRKHTGEKPYACDFCPMRFGALNVLKNHRRLHTGEKPYSCPVCKKKFTQQGDCNIHMKTHEGSKTHDCVCGKQFPIPSRLTTHKKSCKLAIKETNNVEVEATNLQKRCDELIQIDLVKMCDD